VAQKKGEKKELEKIAGSQVTSKHGGGVTEKRGRQFEKKGGGGRGGPREPQKPRKKETNSEEGLKRP